MRVFATVAFSFAAAVFLAVLLPWSGWYLWAAGALTLCAAAVAVLHRRLPHARRLLLILCALALGLAYYDGYAELVCRPATEQCGEEHPYAAQVWDWPAETDRGAKVTVRLRPGVRAVYYGGREVMELRPGQQITGTAYWQDASRIRETDITTFTARGVFVLLYGRDDPAVESGQEGSILFLPQRCSKAMKEKIAAVWDDPATESFLLAELIGDRSHLSAEHSAALSETGLAHLFAVSGLHCAFLVTLVGLLIPAARRRLYSAVCIFVLLFYMAVVGMTPSVVRACIMQIALLVAPLLRRDGDGLTSLSAALLVLLLANPYAAAGISLQMSFAATLGLVLFSDRIYGFLTGLYRGKRRRIKRLVSVLAANISATLAALLFTAPLTAYYFDVFALIAPVSNILAVPAAEGNFITGLLNVMLGFVWQPLARITGWLNWAMVRFVLFIAHALMRVPEHALHFVNPYFKYWLGYVYVLLAVCIFRPGPRRRWLISAALAALTLLLCVGIHGREYRYGSMSAVVTDVGQGECVILCSGDEAVVVDCGSGNSYIDAGRRAADQLSAMGIRRLSALVLTHYHADHANGVAALLSRVPADRLWIPDIEDEFGVRDRVTAQAAADGADVTLVTAPRQLTLGEAVLTVFPPIGRGDMNEQGLTVLCSAGDFDLLITGDMAGSTERELIGNYDLPDTEVLVVSHHGSKYSSAREFLLETSPETAVISVGDNGYGHPTEEAMGRLAAAGAEIYRTDRQGSILITVQGGKD
ncbi:MAG: DNA internalization-related competence protein ComEC/Rec2 [Oscillospiraceae bacterium]|nr:DNA internalization-related competence protein ComEC/Rec2 [Oscillospiraceae bacterium]